MMETANQVAVLFARADSVYKTLPGVDVWDVERDARKWPGGGPVVAHPPCRSWGRVRALAKPRDDERELATWAMQMVRQYGGVLEHPAMSTLFVYSACKPPGLPDEFGGWVLPISQFWWGHRAEKLTWLYIVGVHPDDVPLMPMQLGRAERIVGSSSLRSGNPGYRMEVTKREREATPPELARWLVQLALTAKAPKRG